MSDTSRVRTEEEWANPAVYIANLERELASANAEVARLKAHAEAMLSEICGGLDPFTDDLPFSVRDYRRAYPAGVSVYPKGGA